MTDLLKKATDLNNEIQQRIKEACETADLLEKIEDESTNYELLILLGDDAYDIKNVIGQTAGEELKQDIIHKLKSNNEKNMKDLEEYVQLLSRNNGNYIKYEAGTELQESSGNTKVQKNGELTCTDLDDDTLRELYINQNKTLAEISGMYHTNKSYLYGRCKAAGLSKYNKEKP